LDQVIRISVVICSHNPRPDYLARVLEQLKTQTLPREEWELLVVDNISHEPLAGRFDLSWHPHYRCVHEPELGLTRARLCGIREASGSLLVYLDDDNLLAPDYLERAAAIEQTFPHLGVYGAGIIEPEFEIRPSRQLIPWLGRLAIRHSSSPRWTNNPKDLPCLPWGAGLCVTRQIAGAYLQLMETLAVCHLFDRRGERLFCGGDDLFSWVAARNGAGFGIFPELRITHLIGAHRLSEEYVLRLVHDHGYSHTILNYVFFGDRWIGRGIEGTARMLLHTFRHGWFSMRCQWSAARGAKEAWRFLCANDIKPVLRDGAADAAAPMAVDGPTAQSILGISGGIAPPSTQVH
jgi:glycosyltransferase involved in cell wall biosynthesis